MGGAVLSGDFDGSMISRRAERLPHFHPRWGRSTWHEKFVLERLNQIMKHRQTLKYSVLGVLVVTLLVGAIVYLKRGSKNPLDKYFTVRADRGSVRHTVTSTGTLQAVVTVQVGSQVSGRIQELHADFNSVVKNGQILAVIDPANFEAQRQRAEGCPSHRRGRTICDSRNYRLSFAYRHRRRRQRGQHLGILNREYH